MPIFQQLSASGDGTLPLNQLVQIQYVEWKIRSSGSILQPRSGVSPRRVMHCGWVSFTGNSIATTTDAVQWHKYVEFEHENLYLVPYVIFGDTMRWHFDTGNVVDLYVQF